MKTKTTRTYTIDDNLYNIFKEITNKEKINKSKLIESFIKEYIDKHLNKTDYRNNI
jgi:metal-responsive CopG/Arc/MetJ family transcriptional regulator